MDKTSLYSELFSYLRKHLLLFNLMVCGLGGLTAILLNYTFLFWNQLFFSIVWIAIANFFFFLGFVVDFLVIRLSDGHKTLATIRDGYFWVVSIFWTLLTITTTLMSPFLLL